MKFKTLFFLVSLSPLVLGQQNQEIERTNSEEATLSWDGITGRAYVIQSSTDLINWSYLPFVEYSSASTSLTHTFSSTEGGKFVRLYYKDVHSSGNPNTEDFDSDGIPNLFEVGTLQTDPFDSNSSGGDSDIDGLNDGWELYHFGDLTSANPTVIQSGDGLTNKEKSELGLDPHQNYTAPTATVKASYSYDSVGRLTQVSNTVSSATYTLDVEGNILTSN